MVTAVRAAATSAASSAGVSWATFFFRLFGDRGGAAMQLFTGLCRTRRSFVVAFEALGTAMYGVREWMVIVELYCIDR